MLDRNLVREKGLDILMRARMGSRSSLAKLAHTLAPVTTAITTVFLHQSAAVVVFCDVTQSTLFLTVVSAGLCVPLTSTLFTERIPQLTDQFDL